MVAVRHRSKYCALEFFRIARRIKPTSDLIIRTLTSSDLPRADEILSSAFGFSESRQPELQRYLRLQPDGWFIGAQANGLPVAMVGAVNYGAFAYVGMMAVHQDSQRQGLGLRLMVHLLADLQAKNCPIVLLDASASGRPFYLQLGFIEEGLANVYLLPYYDPLFYLTGCQVELIQSADLPGLAAYDRPIFGADRSKFLKMLLDDLPGRAFLTRSSSGQINGFLFAQPGGRIGPWLANNPQDAGKLLNAALALPYDQVMPWVISPSSNKDAELLLFEAGFIFERCCTHMRLGGQRHPGQRTQIYGQHSLAIG